MLTCLFAYLIWRHVYVHSWPTLIEFPLLSYENSLYILDTRLWPNLICKYCLPFCGLPFTFLSFWSTSYFNFDEVQFIPVFFLRLLLILVSYLRKLCLILSHNYLFLYFLLTFYSFSSCIYLSIYFQLTLYMVRWGLTLCFLHVDFLYVDPVLSIEDTILSSLNCFDILVTIYLRVHF